MAKVAVAPAYLLLSGKTMALGDVTEVTFAYPPLIGDAVIKNGNGLMLVIEKFPGANTLEVTRGVDQALAELQPRPARRRHRRQRVPPGVVRRRLDRQPDHGASSSAACW